MTSSEDDPSRKTELDTVTDSGAPAPLLADLRQLIDEARHTAAVTFNASLMSQMRSLNFIQGLLADGRLQEGSGYRGLLLHRIDGGEAMEQLSAASRMNADSAMMDRLFALGQSAAERWLAEHFDALGRHGTVDIARDYLGGPALEA